MTSRTRRFLPRLTQYRNEVVVWLGVVATVATQVAASLDGVDVMSIDQWVALAPLVASIIGSGFAYGSETIAAEHRAAERRDAILVEKVVQLEADK